MKNFIVSTFAEKRPNRKGVNRLMKPQQRMVRVQAETPEKAVFAVGAVGVSNQLDSKDFGLISIERVFNFQPQIGADWQYAIVSEVGSYEWED